MPSTTITATVTVPEDSRLYGMKLTLVPQPHGSRPASAPQQTAPTPSNPVVIKYAAAVLKGQTDLLDDWAQSFTGSEGAIKKDGDKWILESHEFVSCTAGDQLFSLAEEILSRIHRILALYINAVPVFSVDYVKFVTQNDKGFRQIRASDDLNIVSSKGIAELKTLSGTEPLGSAVLRAMNSSSAVKEALSLHGDGALTWSQMYDIIEFVGGERKIVQEGFASREEVRRVRQTANHYRHLGDSPKYPLPPKTVSLNQGSDFIRQLLKRWIAKRLP